MKSRRTISYGTVNPSYPESHSIRYESRMVCDCTWGRQWTRRYLSVELPSDLVNRVKIQDRVAQVIAESYGGDHYGETCQRATQMVMKVLGILP